MAGRDSGVVRRRPSVHVQVRLPLLQVYQT